jgi:hypothetical protein
MAARHRLTVLLLLLLGVAARADTPSDPKAILDRALKVSGGEDKLAKYKAGVFKMTGTLREKGQPLDFKGELTVSGADKQKVVIVGDAAGVRVKLITVLNGDKGWNQLNDETEEMGQDELTEAKEAAFTTYVTTLAPLKGEGFSLARLPEIKVDKRPAVGFRVSYKGRRDINLFFDKETGLLVKTESRVKDEATGQEALEETVYRDYKEVQGTKQAMAFTTLREGKPYLEAKITSIELLEKVDDKVFAKPE